VNLGTGRIVIILALVVAGVLVLANGFGDASTVTSGSPTSAPSGTDTSTPGPTGSASGGPTQTPAPNTTGVTFMALNGTSVTGAGAAVQILLEADGYLSPVDAADSPVQGVTTTTIYYRPGPDAAQNQSDATYVNQQYFGGKGQVVKLDQNSQSLYADVVPKSASVVIVVGSDAAAKLVAGK
jgi:hypothetical protein